MAEVPGDLGGLLELVRGVVAKGGGRLIYYYPEVSDEPSPGPRVDEIPVPREVAGSLARLGISRLYEFQWRAFKEISEGHDVVITAGTGTGKTEAFLLPVLSSIISEGRPGAYALLVYPTKALARDQARRLDALISGSGVRYAILDGDVPAAERRRIYEDPPPIIITNPDMIHVGLALSKDFRNLVTAARVVVIDELHVYQGVLGAHMRWILKRLSDAARHEIQFVGSGATIGNPGSLASAIFDRSDVKVVEGPRRRKGRALHAFVDYGASSRWTFAARLIAELVRQGLKVLGFVDSQQMAELLARIVSKTFGVEARVHRAGLQAEYRRAVERDFAEGRVKAVVATSTLELGIDIGDLDAVVMAALPKSFSSYLQRAGRAGRRDRPGLVVTLLGDDPIESYYARRPSEYFNRSPEPGFIEPNNIEVAKLHAAAMLLERGSLDLSSLSGPLAEALGELAQIGVAKLVGGRALVSWRSAKEYVEARGIRSSGPMVGIYHNARRIGEREMPMALYDLYPGAVYYHAGRPYLSSSLDVAGLRAAVVQLGEDVSFYTKPLYDIEVLEVRPLETRRSGAVALAYGDVKIKVSVNGYVVKDSASGATISESYYEAPITWEYWTKGVLLRYPLADFPTLESSLSAYHAVEHVLISAARPVVGAGDTDLSGVSYPTGHIVIYDSHVGGNGLSKLVYERFEEVQLIALDIVSGCTCEDGCPKCVFSPYCGSNNRYLSRRGAVKVLRSAVAVQEAAELHKPTSEEVKGDVKRLSSSPLRAA